MNEHASITLDPAEMYWGVLPAGACESPGPGAVCARTPELDDAFQSALPLNIRDLHTTYLPLSDGRILAAGIAPDLLKARAGDRTISACPSVLPAAVSSAAPAVAPDQWNLLVGEFLPQPIRLTRRRREFTAALGVLLIAAIAVVGLERRRVHANAIASEAGAELVAAAGALAPSSGADPIIALRQELTRLAASRRADDSGNRDAALHAAEAVFAAWPRDADAGPYVRTASVAISGAAIVINAEADSRDDARRLIEALRTAQGWTLLEPEMRAPPATAGAAPGPVSLTLRLVPATPAPPASKEANR